MQTRLRQRAIGAAAAACLAALCLWAVPAQGAVLNDQKPPFPPSSPNARPSAIEVEGAKVAQLAKSRHALGSYYDERTRQHVLVTPKSGPGSEVGPEAMRQVGVNGRVVKVDLSQANVDDFQGKIARQAQVDGHKNAYSSYLDLASGVMVLETDAPDNVVRTLTSSLPGHVEVRKSSPKDAFSRTDDIEPYWGGAGIKSGGAVCSAGFPVKNGAGTRFMVTAGHCFGMGATVLTESGANTVGTVVARGPLPPFDMELIGGRSYGTRIYVGPVVTTASKPIAGGGDPVVGFSGYCFSGRTSGERCNQRANSVTAQVCTQTGCKSPVIEFSGGGAPQGGDSGSPFYVGAVSGDNVFMRGMVIATDGTRGWAHLYSTISSHFGVTTP